MNILRLSTLSVTLAIAVFALGYNTSFAGKPDSDGNHPHGDGGEDKTETVFLVEMQPGTLGATDDEPAAEGLVTSAGGVDACGSTKGESRPGGVGAVFADDCALIYVNFVPAENAPFLLELWYVQVNLNKSTVSIAFRADGENNLFVINNLSVTITPDPVELSSSFTVDVNRDKLTAERNHNPGKGDLVGDIAIGNIVYTPVP